jgi:hypothetical protein
LTPAYGVDLPKARSELRLQAVTLATSLAGTTRPAARRIPLTDAAGATVLATTSSAVVHRGGT